MKTMKVKHRKWLKTGDVNISINHMRTRQLDDMVKRFPSWYL